MGEVPSVTHNRDIRLPEAEKRRRILDTEHSENVNLSL